MNFPTQANLVEEVVLCKYFEGFVFKLPRERNSQAST